MELLPGPLDEKRRQVQAAQGRPVVVRGVQTTDSAFRGRLRVEPGRVVIEYQVAEHGYFWHVPTIERLLSLALEGETSVELREPCPSDEEPRRERSQTQ